MDLQELYEQAKNGNQESLDTLRAEAEVGKTEALHFLATMYRNGEGIRKNRKKALELYQQAAEKGCLDSMRALAEIYTQGDGVEKDPAKAAEWERRVTEPGQVRDENEDDEDEDNSEEQQQTKWRIRPTKYRANEIWKYSKDKNTVIVTDNLKWSAFICTKDGDGIPEVNTHDIFQTPGEIEWDECDTFSHEVDTDGCDKKTKAWLKKVQKEGGDLDDVLPEHGWERSYRVEVEEYYLTCLEGPHAGKCYDMAGEEIYQERVVFNAAKYGNLALVCECIAAGANLEKDETLYYGVRPHSCRLRKMDIRKSSAS